MATRTFLGRAVAAYEIYTITVANTWATSDTATLTINGKDLVLTVGTDATTANVATAIKEMVNGDTQTGTGDHTFSQTGDKVGEFSRITATVSSSVVTLTADDLGVPFTLSVSESTGGSGVLTPSNTQDATGPSWWTNADNWSGDTVPVTGDTVVFDGSSDADVLYGLSTGIQPAEVIVTSDYTGRIGLPKINTDNATLPYDEYRGDYLAFSNDANTNTTTFTLGDGDGQQSQRIKFDLADTTAVTINVLGSGEPLETGVPTILLKGTDSATILNVSRGQVGIAFYEGESGHLATLRVAYIDNQLGDARVVCGGGVDLTNATIDISGGVVDIDSTTSSGTIDILEGEVTLKSGAHASITVDGGTVYYRSNGTLTALIVGSDGTIDFTRDQRPRTVSACDIFEGATINDPFRTVTWSAGIDLNRCSPSEVDLNIGTHLRLTPGSVA